MTELSDSEVDKLDDSLISLHDEQDDYTGESLLVATCECGRSWILRRNHTYWRTKNQWRHIVKMHVGSDRHALAMMKLSRP